MAAPYYNTGTATLTAGSTAMVGQGTMWEGWVRPGDQVVSYAGQTAVVGEVVDNTHITLARAFRGTSQTAAAYEIMYTPDDPYTQTLARGVLQSVSESALVALSGVPQEPRKIVGFDPSGSASLYPFEQFVNGAKYDVQVANIGARAAYNSQPVGFAVLVSDVGDGRAAIYSREGVAGNWSPAAYVTGPVGPLPVVQAGTTTTLAPGNDATVTGTAITGGLKFDFAIPRGEGFSSKGTYSGATAYVKGDVVLYNGSSWIAKIATTGNTPPSLPTTSNTQWNLLATKGTDGTGTGDVVGPTNAVDGNIAVFDGTTGKVQKDGGLPVSAIATLGRAINGLLLSNNSSAPNTVLNISPGSCRDKDQSMDMVLSSGWAKSTGTWAAGSGYGMLDTGTRAANSGYHVFLIYNPTTKAYDFLCSLSAAAPTMPSGFTKRRRIGAFVTDSSANIKTGMWYASGEFRFGAAFAVVEAAAGNALTLKQLPVPLGVKLKVFGQAFGSASPDVGFWIIIRDPDVGAIADNNTQWYDAQIYKKLGSNDGSAYESWTDTSGQVYHVAYPRTATNLIYIYLQGWIDLREEFA